MKFIDPKDLRGTILLIRFSAIGDVILATAALQALLDRVPIDRILWIGTEPSLSLIKSSYPDLSTLNFKELENFDFLKDVSLVFDLQVNKKSLVFCSQLKKVAKCKIYRTQKVYGRRYGLLIQSYFFGRLIKRKPLEEVKPQYELMAETVLFPFSKTSNLENYKPTLKIAENPKTFSFLKKSNIYFALALGASFPEKRSPPTLLASIINKVQAKTPCTKLRWLFLGDYNDRKNIPELLQNLDSTIRFHDLTGSLSLEELPFLLSKASALLTNDSGLLHMAEAVGTPVAALFGPTVEDFGFGPHLPASSAFSATLGCRPCSKHGNLSCRYKDRACFHQISSEKVSSFLSGFIKEHR